MLSVFVVNLCDLLRLRNSNIRSDCTERFSFFLLFLEHTHRKWPFADDSLALNLNGFIADWLIWKRMLRFRRFILIEFRLLFVSSVIIGIWAIVHFQIAVVIFVEFHSWGVRTLTLLGTLLKLLRSLVKGCARQLFVKILGHNAIRGLVGEVVALKRIILPWVLLGDV